jgi:hypothetical protein
MTVPLSPVFLAAGSRLGVLGAEGAGDAPVGWRTR